MTKVSSSYRVVEVAEQGGDGLVGGSALTGVLVDDLSMGVPAAIVELNEADAALDQAPGQQTVVGKRILARFCTVSHQRSRFFLTEVVQFGYAALHAKSHHVRGDSRQDFRVVELAVSTGGSSAKVKPYVPKPSKKKQGKKNK